MYKGEEGRKAYQEIPSHIPELAKNIRRNLRHMHDLIEDEYGYVDDPVVSQLYDFINHIDAIAQQIEEDV